MYIPKMRFFKKEIIKTIILSFFCSLVTILSLSILLFETFKTGKIDIVNNTTIESIFVVVFLVSFLASLVINNDNGGKFIYNKFRRVIRISQLVFAIFFLIDLLTIKNGYIILVLFILLSIMMMTTEIYLYFNVKKLDESEIIDKIKIHHKKLDEEQFNVMKKVTKYESYIFILLIILIIASRITFEKVYNTIPIYTLVIFSIIGIINTVFMNLIYKTDNNKRNLIFNIVALWGGLAVGILFRIFYNDSINYSFEIGIASALIAGIPIIINGTRRSNIKNNHFDLLDIEHMELSKIN